MKHKPGKKEDVFEGLNGVETYDQVYRSSPPKQQRKMDLLKFNGHFSETEIIDLILGRKSVINMLLPELWHNPEVILSSKEALIYIVKIVLKKPCDGSEDIRESLPKGCREREIIENAFAEGVFSGNIHSTKDRTWEECLRYANQQVNTLLRTSLELNGDQKYVPENRALGIYRRHNDAEITALYRLYKDGDWSEHQKEQIYQAMVEREMVLIAEEMKFEADQSPPDFSKIDPEFLEKLGFNPDGTRKAS